MIKSDEGTSILRMSHQPDSVMKIKRENKFPEKEIRIGPKAINFQKHRPAKRLQI